MRIRRATLDDVPAIAVLNSELGYPTTSAEMRPRVETMLARDGDALFVAEEDVVVAWMHVSEDVTVESAARAEIRGLVVTEEQRGSGIGARLVEAAEQWARERGLPRMRVRCNAIRERTHRFYERHGYRVKKTQKVFDKELP